MTTLTLKDAVQERYSVMRLVALTNPDTPASTIDHTKFDAAVRDAQAEFVDHVGTQVDMTNDRHVKTAVAMVEVLLMEKGSGGISAAAGLRSRTEASMTTLSASSTTSRQGIRTNTENQFRATRTPYPVIPWSDRYRMRGMLPHQIRFTGNEYMA